MLNDAILDVATEVRGGVALADAVAAVAADYGLNPALLTRKVGEAYPNGVPALADANWLADANAKLAALDAEERTYDEQLDRQLSAVKAAMRRASRTDYERALAGVMRLLVS